MDPSYNNGFGVPRGPIVSGGDTSGMAPRPMMNGGGGNIILQPDGGSEGRTKKKWLVIGAVIAIVLAVGFAVAAVVMGNRNNGDTQISNNGDSDGKLALVAPKNTREAFNSLANYLFYGNTDAGDFSMPDGLAAFSELFIVSSNMDKEWRTEYFAVAAGLLDNLKTKATEEYKDVSGEGVERFWILVDGINVSITELSNYAAQDNEQILNEDESQYNNRVAYVYAALDACDNIEELFRGVLDA